MITQRFRLGDLSVIGGKAKEAGDEVHLTKWCLCKVRFWPVCFEVFHEIAPSLVPIVGLSEWKS